MLFATLLAPVYLDQRVLTDDLEPRGLRVVAEDDGLPSVGQHRQQVASGGIQP